MPEILLGVVVLVLGLWAVNAFSKADPKQAARVLRAIGGAGALIFAGFLLLRGEIGRGRTVGLFGLGLARLRVAVAGDVRRRTQKSAGQASRVRTDYLEMELDHDSGAMHGRILEGRLAGTALDSARPHGADRAARARSTPTAAIYLQLILIAGRPAGVSTRKAMRVAGGGPRPSSSGKMTEEEAYQILGIQPGASAQDISRAHRSLMKKLHPDQGGTTYLAARVNEAKDVLLRRHR